VDLHPIRTPPTADEIAAVEAVLREHAAPGRPEASRHLLLPALHALQARVGWISPGGLGEACRRLRVPPAEGYGVASFYAWFSLKERPRRVVHVCDDLACRARGAEKLCTTLGTSIGPPGDARGSTTWLRSPCLGLCDQAPAALLQQAGPVPHEASWSADERSVAEVLAGGAPPPRPPAVIDAPGAPTRGLLRRVGRVDPTRLDAYRAAGGYQALRRALELGPEAVIAEVSTSRLQGRGGAAFPTGRKWAAVRSQPAEPRWLVCNADESEPGTFKDRVLMEGDPFALVEAMTIAAYAAGCARGIIYLRAEYPLALTRLEGALQQARGAGLLGDNILGAGLSFDIELRRGAGAYICGEETALLESIEGFRGEPRSKPPFPVETGLFGQPTLINNVETLMNVPEIILRGGAAFAAQGTPGSTGTRLFCLCGQVQRPGLIEAPFGVRLGELITRAGGVEGGRGVGAVLLGGAAGTFVGPAQLDLPLTFEDTRRVGATLGSGVVLVLDDTVDLMPYLQRIAAFFRDESCGQCTPCRVGTVRQEELLARLVRNQPLGGLAQERVLLQELGQCMRDASICGLGQTASSAIESALALQRQGGAT
jgi:NADH-quinone oxidoreductase subunit F